MAEGKVKSRAFCQSSTDTYINNWVEQHRQLILLFCMQNNHKIRDVQVKPNFRIDCVSLLQTELCGSVSAEHVPLHAM